MIHLDNFVFGPIFFYLCRHVLRCAGVLWFCLCVGVRVRSVVHSAHTPRPTREPGPGHKPARFMYPWIRDMWLPRLMYFGSETYGLRGLCTLGFELG